MAGEQIKSMCTLTLKAPTDHQDSVPMGRVAPDRRGDGHQVVSEVVEDVDVLPVVEGIGCLRLRPLDEP